MVMRNIRKGASRMTGMHGTFSGKKKSSNSKVTEPEVCQKEQHPSLDTVDELIEDQVNSKKEEVTSTNDVDDLVIPRTFSSDTAVISNVKQNHDANITTNTASTIDTQNKDTDIDTPTATTTSKTIESKQSSGNSVMLNKKLSILFLILGIALGMTTTLFVVDRTEKSSGEDMSVNAKSSNDKNGGDSEEDSATRDYMAVHTWIQQYEKAYQSFASSSSLVFLSSHQKNNNKNNFSNKNKNKTTAFIDKEQHIYELQDTFQSMFVSDAVLNYESIGGIQGSLHDTMQFLQEYDTNFRYMFGVLFFPPWHHSITSNIHDCTVEIIEETIVQHHSSYPREDKEGDQDDIDLIAENDDDDDDDDEGKHNKTTIASPNDVPPPTKVVKALVHGTFFHPVGIQLQDYNDYMDIDLFPELTLIVKGTFTHQLQKIPPSQNHGDDASLLWKSVYTEESIDNYKQIMIGFAVIMCFLLYLVFTLVSFVLKCCLWILGLIFGVGRKRKGRTTTPREPPTTQDSASVKKEPKSQ